MPLDPGKPPPQDVLKTLSLSHEFENKLIEFCGEAENSLLWLHLRKKCKIKAVNDIINDEGNSVGLEHVTPNNIDAEPLKNAKEKEIIKSLSPQVSICEEDGPILTEGRNTSIEPLSWGWVNAVINNYWNVRSKGNLSWGCILLDVGPFHF